MIAWSEITNYYIIKFDCGKLHSEYLKEINFLPSQIYERRNYFACIVGIEWPMTHRFYIAPRKERENNFVLKSINDNNINIILI